MCLARSFFSSRIDAQFDTGATHDIRILTGSALRGAERVRRGHCGQREFQRAHEVLPG